MNYSDEDFFVVTRTGKRELLDTNKITNRIKYLINLEPKINHVNAHEIMLEVSKGITHNITTYEIDEYAATVCANLSLRNPYYMKVASRIAIDNHQKRTKRSFVDKMREAYMRNVNGKITPLLNSNFYKFVEKFQDRIELLIDYKRDFLLDFFGFRTFQRIYSIKINDVVIERPQDSFMRIAIALHYKIELIDMDYQLNTSTDEVNFIFDKIKNTYDLLSNKLYTHGSPMYFNAGTNHPQYASCFLLGTEDSLEGIKSTEFDMAKISKFAGGIGVHINEWRSEGAVIKGTNGLSSGLVPFLRMYNNTMLAFNQGGKRVGSCAVYLMPHHPDIINFIKLKRNDGTNETRARELFYAVWLPDLFMERVKNGEIWSLFDPHDTEDLSEYYDEKDCKSYTNKYLELENKGLYKKQLPAREIWNEIFESNRQRGMPYICFSDNANRQSNQKNLGVIKSSNLCAEIYEYSNSKETAVCNLVSVNLERCVIDTAGIDDEFPENPEFDFNMLKENVKTVVYNLNQVIDRNYYPTDLTARSNLRHRPIGIGVQGQANAYMKLRYPFESDNAYKLNKYIYETMLYAAYSESTRICKAIYKKAVETCKTTGIYRHIKYLQAPNYLTQTITYNDAKDIPKNIGAYSSMYANGGSPMANGKFPWELAGLNPSDLSGMWDWETLREHISIYGMRNSLCLALMPTASTSQFLGNNECFEPFTSNIYKRKTIAGEFIVINKYLINDLYKLGIWSENVKDYMLQLEGSIQYIEDIPKDLKDLYKTAWEIPQSVLIQQSIDRQPFIDQGQSLNLYVENLNLKTFTSLMFKAWKGGLKTGKYYMHTRPASMPQKFTISHNKQEEISKMLKSTNTKFLEPLKDVCDLCSA